MFTVLILAVAFALVLAAFAVIAGIVSYLRDPQALARRAQYRENLARIDSLTK